MKKSKLFLAVLLGILCLSSCSDDDDNEQLPGNVNKYEFLNATSYTDWVYFSFEKGKIVDITDPENDLSWDIAFHRGDMRLNGGESGKGKGAAVNTNKTDWNTVTEAPASGYITDKIGTITTAFTGDGIEEAEQSFSQTLATWLTIDTSNPPPVYTYHNWVYVIKTADGKYVKLQVYDYKDEKNSLGAYISFKYQYNESGSTKFE
ncbi:HmuY family protein [Dysgonomonas sp. 511]|uniref:HmuY family protein n=1 Tax=Dysgonomonas sp. 511 TaxID=2302930 RepID=UPI0013D36309|nr:HmuY family protein [Dysgonomonas sp. 511]NDV78962.1 heme-containing protein HmuY [Dysgonomonas sp. 511]